MQILIPLAILFLIFWFFIALPQRRRQRAHAEMQDTVGVGDEVITAGGLHGNVVEFEDSVARIEIAPGTVVRVDRRAIAARVAPEEPEEPEELEEPEPEADEPAEAPSAADGDAG